MKLVKCKLTKDNVTYHHWIIEQAAKVGNIIDIRIDEIWIEGCKIEEVYNDGNEITGPKIDVDQRKGKK